MSKKNIVLGGNDQVTGDEEEGAQDETEQQAEVADISGPVNVVADPSIFHPYEQVWINGVPRKFATVDGWLASQLQAGTVRKY